MIQLLGKPDYIDTTSIGKFKKCYYTIFDYYGFDIDLKYSKWLTIEFDTLGNKIYKMEIYKTEDKRNILEKIFAN
ncbi:MAG: hypothetical protein WCP85_31445 [Mariniphaga sp.]